MAAMNDPLAGPAPAASAERYVPGSGETRRHVLVVIVNNRPGVLNRVASVRARNFNIESLAVGHTERPDISRMTITLRGDSFAVEQMAKQLYRMIDVLKVQDLPERASWSTSSRSSRSARPTTSAPSCSKIVELYKGRVLDIGPDTVVVEHAGTEQEIDSLVALLGGFGIREMVRTGTSPRPWLGRRSTSKDPASGTGARRPCRHRHVAASRGGSLMPARMYYDADAPANRSRARRSPSSGTAARATPTRRTSATAGSTSSWA